MQMTWQFWALASAGFVALTAILAKLGDAARVAPIDKLSVTFVAVFAAVSLGEHLSLPNWLGVGLMASGAVLLAWRG